MTKKISVLLMAIAVTATAWAQDGGRGNWGGQRRTVEERVASNHQKWDSTFHFATDKQAKVDSAFAEMFRTQDKLREEARANFTAGQRPDEASMQAMREKVQELQIARDEKLQGILTEVEYKKWKNELEPSLRPKRGEGMGGGRQRDGK